MVPRNKRLKTKIRAERRAPDSARQGLSKRQKKRQSRWNQQGVQTSLPVAETGFEIKSGLRQGVGIESEIDGVDEEEIQRYSKCIQTILECHGALQQHNEDSIVIAFPEDQHFLKRKRKVGECKGELELGAATSLEEVKKAENKTKEIEAGDSIAREGSAVLSHLHAHQDTNSGKNGQSTRGAKKEKNRKLMEQKEESGITFSEDQHFPNRKRKAGECEGEPELEAAAGLQEVKKAENKKKEIAAGNNIARGDSVVLTHLHAHQDTNPDKNGQSTRGEKKRKLTEQKEESVSVVECMHLHSRQETPVNVSVSFQSVDELDSTNLRTVYVGGIPYSSCEDDIRAFFGDCGSIIEVSLKTFPDSGRFRGIALIMFRTEQAAQRALALDGTSMGDHFLKVKPCITKAKETPNRKVYKDPPKKTEGYTRAYVGNLSWNIKDEDLREFFEGCSISGIRFALDKMTGEFKGYAHVDFTDDKSLEMALQLDQHLLLGRPLKIAYALPKNDGKSEEVLRNSSKFKRK